MHRAGVILAVFVALVGATLWALTVALRQPIELHLRTRYGYRDLIEAALGSAKPPVDVVWLGDSTVMPGTKTRAYPRLLERRQLAPMHRRSIVVAAPGLDLYGYYALMGRALALRPQLVVMIANLRLFDPRGLRSLNELMELIPVEELPRALLLPYSVRGMTAPRLLLGRWLEAGHVAGPLQRLEALRLLAAEAEWWSALGSRHPPRSEG